MTSPHVVIAYMWYLNDISLEIARYTPATSSTAQSVGMVLFIDAWCLTKWFNLGCTWNQLRIFINYLCLVSTPRGSDITGLGLGWDFKILPGDSKMYSLCEIPGLKCLTTWLNLCKPHNNIGGLYCRLLILLILFSKWINWGSRG